MDAEAQTSLADLESQRARLEENAAKLRQSLKHWQTWDAEYDGLKGEIEDFDGEPSYDDLLEIGRSFGGELLNEQEIRDLSGVSAGISRSSEQIIEVIARRIDCQSTQSLLRHAKLTDLDVHRNAWTVKKQLWAVEDNLAGIWALCTTTDLRDEEGLPVQDIHEELDEEGNIVSSSVLNPAEAAPQIVSALRKTGINKKAISASGEDQTAGDPEGKGIAATSDTSPRPPLEPSKAEVVDESTKHSEDTQAQRDEGKSRKKSVAFAENIDIVETQPPTKEKLETEKSEQEEREDIARGSFHSGTRVIELNEFDEEVGSTPIIPPHESPEDAVLRRQMLRYGMNEVGPVVAQLDLEDAQGDDHFPDDDFDGDSDEDGSHSYASSFEDEDEYGMRVRGMLNEEYRKEMMKLEERLGVRMMENVGPQPPRDLEDLADKVAEDTQPARVVAEKPKTPEKEQQAQKKGVKFADDLDVSPSGATEKAASSYKPAVTKPVSETILERIDSAPPTAQEASTRKPSRFKAKRAGEIENTSNPSPFPAPSTFPQLEMPQGPPNRTLSSNVVERPVPADGTSAPPPDAEDLESAPPTRQEIATAYYNNRNRLIKQQGGFMPSEEEEEDPLMEEKDGKVRKVSRFKAARLKPAMP